MKADVTPIEMAQALLAYWQAKLGTYLETKRGIADTGEMASAGEWKGGTYKEINERRAQRRVEHYTSLLSWIKVIGEPNHDQVALDQLADDYKRLIAKSE